MVSKLFVSSAIFAALTAPLVSGAGVAVIKNACSFPIYEHVVYSPILHGGHPFNVTTPPGGQSTLYYPDNGQSLAIKLGPSLAVANGPSNPNGPNGPFQAEISYDHTRGLVYYDFSTLDGNPFNAYYRRLIPSISGCQVISCPPNKNNPACSPGAYYPGEPSSYNPVYACNANANLVIQIC